MGVSEVEEAEIQTKESTIMMNLRTAASFIYMYGPKHLTHLIWFGSETNRCFKDTMQMQQMQDHIARLIISLLKSFENYSWGKLGCNDFTGPSCLTVALPTTKLLLLRFAFVLFTLKFPGR